MEPKNCPSACWHQPFAFAVAAWMRYCLGKTEAGEVYALRDPRAGEIASTLAGVPRDAAVVSDALRALPGLFPVRLVASEKWRGEVSQALGRMLERGMQGAVVEEENG